MKKRLFCFVFTIIVLTLIFECYLIHFGNPLTDESFPASIAWRFQLGQRPFIDDLSPYIGTGLLLLPLIKINSYFHTENDYLILFLRQAFILVMFLLALYNYNNMRSKISKSTSFLISLLIFIYHPFNTNNIHYDTMALTLWVSILFANLSFINNRHSFFSYIFLLNLVLLILLFYPTYIFIIPLYLIGVTFLLKNKIQYLLAAALVFILSAVFFYSLFFLYYDLSVTDFHNAIVFARNLTAQSNSNGYYIKLYNIISNLLANYSFYIIVIVSAILLAKFFRHYIFSPVVLILFLTIYPLLHIYLPSADYNETFFYTNLIGFGGIFVYLFLLKKTKNNNLIVKIIWVPSFFAGFLTSLTSYQAGLKFNIGFFPAYLASLIFIENYLRQELIQYNKSLFNFTRTIFFVFQYFIIVFFQWNYIYGSLSKGPELYFSSYKYNNKGPFNGLYLDRKTINFISSLQMDVKKIDTSKYYIYFGPVVGGYLLVNHLKFAEVFLYCDYQFAHYNLPIKKPSYALDANQYFDRDYSYAQKYIPVSLYKKIINKKLYDIYKYN